MRALAFALSLALLCPTVVRAQDDEAVTVDEAGLVSTTLVDVPLAEALMQLAEAADVSLVLPASTLEWVDLRVTARLRGVPLPAAFDLLLKVCEVKGRLETTGDTKVLMVDLSAQDALAMAQLELSHAEIVAERAALQARVVERELELRRMQEEAGEEEEEDGEDGEDDEDGEDGEDDDEDERDDEGEMGEDTHEHRHHGPVQGDDGEWEEEGEDEEDADEDRDERGEQMDEEEDESSMAPAPGHKPDEARLASVKRLLERAQLRARDSDDRAIDDLEEVLRLDPNNTTALVWKASLLIARQEFDAARTHVERALALDPTLADAYFQRGLVSLKARPRQYQAAIDDLSRAIELRPEYAEAHFYRSAAYYDMKQWGLCLDDLARTESLAVAPASYLREVPLIRGHCLYASGDLQGAEQAYEAFLSVAVPGHRAAEKVRQRLEEIRAR